MFGQPVDHRLEVEGRLADPSGQRRAVKFEPGAGVDLRLAVQRTMVGVLGDEHMGDRAFARQRALDEVRRRRGLGDAFLARPRSVLRPHGDDHPKLRKARCRAAPCGPRRCAPSHRSRVDSACSRARSPARCGAGAREDGRGCARTRSAWDAAPAIGAAPPAASSASASAPSSILQGEPELVGMKLLGLLPVHRPAQFATAGVRDGGSVLRG